MGGGWSTQVVLGATIERGNKQKNNPRFAFRPGQAFKKLWLGLVVMKNQIIRPKPVCWRTTSSTRSQLCRAKPIFLFVSNPIKFLASKVAWLFLARAGRESRKKTFLIYFFVLENELRLFTLTDTGLGNCDGSFVPSDKDSCGKYTTRLSCRWRRLQVHASFEDFCCFSLMEETFI